MGVPDYDESVVSDWIRNRKEMPADMVDRRGREIFKVETVKQPEGDYEKELRKLQAFTSNQLDELLAEVENKSKEGRGLFSKGNLLNGYAIDRQTLESLQSRNHDSAGFELATKLFDDLKYSDTREYISIDTIKRRIIKGFVYLNVPGFETPIVKLFLCSKQMGDKVPKKDVKKIVDQIKSDQKLLPINSFFEPL